MSSSDYSSSTSQLATGRETHRGSQSSNSSSSSSTANSSISSHFSSSSLMAALNARARGRASNARGRGAAIARAPTASMTARAPRGAAIARAPTARMNARAPTARMNARAPTMDNYFTTPAVLLMTREKRVGVLGTARARSNFPPREIKEVNDARFNSLYLFQTKGYLIARWIDNNVVLMVSTVHSGNETSRRVRKKPRLTSTNRRFLEQLWGDEYQKVIQMPGLVDNYNYWMNAVDMADQGISYYRSELRCNRTWMPLFLHYLDVMRINAYIIYKEKNKNNRPPTRTLEHKDFLMAFICALNDRATESIGTPNARRQSATPSSGDPSPNAVTPADTVSRKRKRMGSLYPTLPRERLLGNEDEHLHVYGGVSRKCVFCSYLEAVARLEGLKPPKTKRTIKECSKCKMNVCPQHFEVFHNWCEPVAEERWCSDLLNELLENQMNNV